MPFRSLLSLLSLSFSLSQVRLAPGQVLHSIPHKVPIVDGVGEDKNPSLAGWGWLVPRRLLCFLSVSSHCLCLRCLDLCHAKNNTHNTTKVLERTQSKQQALWGTCWLMECLGCKGDYSGYECAIPAFSLRKRWVWFHGSLQGESYSMG